MTVYGADISTPALLVDRDLLELNIAEMATRAADRDVALRPHAKTHKSPAIARMQLDAGAGFTDLFLAYPLWVDPAKGRRLRALADVAELTIGVDSPEAAHALAAQLGDHAHRVSLVVEVDCGQHRSGVAPEDAGALADVVAHTRLDVVGVFTFPGHSYSPGVHTEVARQEAAALATAAAALRDVGIEPRVVSGGSTPTVADVAPGTMTEMRPGVYVFGDAQQWELGSATPDRIALTCLATVVSHAGGRVVLDSGSKALGADRAVWASGYGRLLDHPDARLVQLSEHHAVAAWDGSPLPELGSRVRVVPNHVCNAVNLADTLHVVHQGAIVDRWPVAARGANT